MRIPLTILAILLLAAPGAAQNAPSEPAPLWPADKQLHLPLVVVDTSFLSLGTMPAANRPNPPFLTIGSLPESFLDSVHRQPNNYTPEHDSHIASYADTFPRPGGATAKTQRIVLEPVPFARANALQPTLLEIAAPEVNGGMWVPTAITQSGNIITVHAEVWITSVPGTFVAGRNLFLLSLGKLPAGDYTLQVSCRRFDSSAPDKKGERRANGQAWKGRLDTASVTFTVGAKPGGTPATLALDQIKTALAKIPAQTWTTVRGSYWALPAHLAVAGQPLLQAGYFDAAHYADSFYRLSTDPLRDMDIPEPKLQTAPAGNIPEGLGPTALVYSPVLNSGDWIELESIEYQGRECRLTVGLWRDNIIVRFKNIVHVDKLLIPLQFSPGDNTVSLVWHFYDAIAEDKGFEMQEKDPAGKIIPTTAHVQVK